MAGGMEWQFLGFRSQNFDQFVRARSTTTRDRNLLFRGLGHSPVVFFVFLQGSLCNLARRSPQNVEKVAPFPENKA